MRKSSYEEQIIDALKKAKRTAKTPGTLFALVLEALGDTSETAEQIDARWREFYTKELQQKLEEAEDELSHYIRCMSRSQEDRM